MPSARGFIQPAPSSVRPSPLRICLRADDGDGELSVVEMVLDPRTGPPLHVHPTHAEGFYVLDGDLTVQVGEEIATGGPGTWAYAPKDTAHTLANLTDGAVRVLCMFAPAGFERRFERILAELEGEPLPEQTPAETRTRLIGPPLTERPPDITRSGH